MFVGFLLLLLGVLMLLDRLGVITINIWNYFWPAVIIALGLALIFKGRKKPH